MGKQRTVAEVLEAQSHSQMGGCCDRFAEQSHGDCLELARQYQRSLGMTYPSTPRERFDKVRGGTHGDGVKVSDDGPYPQVHPRSAAAQKAEGELGQFLAGWAQRHGLTRAEYLMLLGREMTRDLERAVVTERRTPDVCPECGGGGYAVHPENGRNKDARRCPRGCPVKCSICNNPNCDNPGGQH